MKKPLSFLICVLIVMSTFLTGCQNASYDDTQERIQVYLPQGAYLDEIIRKYNRYLFDNNYENRYKINVKYFDDEEENTSVTKMVTEIMAGGGPDIIDLGTDIPFEKLMQENIFADINEMIENDTTDEKLDLNGYNSAIMDSCVVDGKRLMIPLAYSINAITASKDMCEKYNIPQDSKFTYSNTADIIKEYLETAQQSDSMSVFSVIRTQLLNLIDDYVDFGESKVYFDTPEFQENFEQLCRLITDYNRNNLMHEIDNYDYSSFFSDSDEEMPEALFSTVSDSIYGGNFFSAGFTTDVLFNGLNKSTDTVSATVRYAFAVNNNSEKKEEVLEFIKYALSQHIQTDWLNGYMPVNTQSFGLKLHYGMIESDRYFHNDDSDSSDSEFITKMLDLIDNVNSCNIPNNYYHNNIIGTIVDDFIAGKISQEKFLSQLKSKTNIFVNE